MDYLKIDGSFVRNMLEDEVDSAMVSTVNHLAKRMGIRTIAEYVETPELMDKLPLMGVDYAQGFGIAAAASLPETHGNNAEYALRLSTCPRFRIPHSALMRRVPALHPLRGQPSAVQICS